MSFGNLVDLCGDWFNQEVTALVLATYSFAFETERFETGQFQMPHLRYSELNKLD